MSHLNSFQLIDYLAGRWTTDQERSIEVHLAQCDECASHAHELYLKAHQFDEWSLKQQKEVMPVGAGDQFASPAQNELAYSCE